MSKQELVTKLGEKLKTMGINSTISSTRISTMIVVESQHSGVIKQIFVGSEITEVVDGIHTLLKIKAA